MAEKKEHTIVDVSSEEKKTAKKASTAARKKVTEDGKTVVEVTPAGSATGYRIGAIILWVLAITCEVIGILTLFGKINITFIPTLAWIIGLLVIDLICVIIGAQLWKKSNRIRPCLSNSALVRTLWHQLGVIMALICLIPLGIFLLLKTKNLNPKVRTILLVAFAALLVGATTASVDYQQPSKEEVAQLQAEAEA